VAHGRAMIPVTLIIARPAIKNSKLEIRMTNQIQNSKFETKAASSFGFRI